MIRSAWNVEQPSPFFPLTAPSSAKCKADEAHWEQRGGDGQPTPRDHTHARKLQDQTCGAQAIKERTGNYLGIYEKENDALTTNGTAVSAPG